MSYQRLPPEIKQLVTQHIHWSDAKYKERQNTSSDDVPRVSTYEKPVMTMALRGKGIANWSRVNKECRQLCSKILFETLEVTRVSKSILQYGIVKGPVARLITSLVVDNYASLSDTGLALFHIVPQLINLRHISVGSIKFFPNPVSEFKHGADEYYWNQLLDIAKSITSWTFEGTHSIVVKALLAANIDNLNSVSFRTPPVSNKHPLLSAISTCSSLSKLEMNFEQASRRGEGESKWFSDTSLSVNYSFAEQLTHLSLDFRAEGMDTSVLDFVSKFSNLQRLQLTCDDEFFSFAASSSLSPSSPSSDSTPTDPDIKRTLLPRLRHLDLRLRFLEAYNDVLKHLELPQLERLSLSSSQTCCHPPFLANVDNQFIDPLAQEICSLNETLRLLELSCRSVQFFVAMEDLQDSIYVKSSEEDLPFAIDFDYYLPASGVASPPPRTRRVRKEGAEEQEEEIVENPYYGQYLTSVTNDICDFAEWLEERTKLLHREDRATEAYEIWKHLQKLEDYRRWLND